MTHWPILHFFSFQFVTLFESWVYDGIIQNLDQSARRTVPEDIKNPVVFSLKVQTSKMPVRRPEGWVQMESCSWEQPPEAQAELILDL